MNPALDLLCDRLVAALLNGGYQGLLLAGTIWLALKFPARTNAATRHAVLLATLFVVALLPAIHFFLPGRVARPVQEDADSVDWKIDSTSEVAALEGESAPPLPEPAMPPLEMEEVSYWANAASVTRAIGELVLRFVSAVPLNWSVSLPYPASIVLIALWAGLAMTRVILLAWQCWALRCLKRQSVEAPEEMERLFYRVCKQMETPRRTRLLIGPSNISPMAAGFTEPAVLLPADVFEGAASVQLEPVFRHELAHLSRWDDWANLGQQFVKAVLFFHPAVWWLGRRLTVEREIACDDHVLAATKTPKEYALFLTEFAGRKYGRDWAVAPAAWNNKSQLKERISMILDSNRNSSPRLARARVGALTGAAIILALLALHAGPRLALAAEKAEVAADPVAASAPRAESAPSAAVSSSAASAPAPAVASVIAPSSVEPVLAQAGAEDSPKVKSPRPRAEDSIERRLDRLEKMVQELIAREKRAESRPSTPNPPSARIKGQMANGLDAQKMEKMADVQGKIAEAQAKVAEKLAKAQIDQDQKEKIMADVKRETDRAAKEVERAMKDANRSAEEWYRKARQPGQVPVLGDLPSVSGTDRQQLESARRSLESQRRSLERQMAAIEKQLNRLEQDKKKLEEHADRNREHEHEHDHDRNKESASKDDANDEGGPRKRKQ